MKISVRGLAFDVSVSGPDGEIPALLLHGFPQNPAMWDAVIPVLHAAGRPTVAPLQRGYSPGARPSDVDSYATGECVADVLAILDALEMPVVDVVGHDWGAIIAWHLAAAHADRVRTLTAVSVPHPTAFGRAIAADPDQQRRSAYMNLFRQEGKAEHVLLEDGAARLSAIFEGLPAERVERYVAPLREPGALTATLNWYRAMSAFDAGCGPVAVPTTFVWGDADVAVGSTAARDCGAHVEGDYRFVPLIGVSHWIADEAPGALTEAILERIDD